ncbi:hypothetical protein FD755_011414 [Muntiacus reevesi]|uniref:Cytochrome c oxidase subunit 7B, mitochondrial n=1 Tax=Muntiacus reevesi TaxID=9886 RepID=A0A5N3XSQ6_MUNRE|nr:hypothetical protein FD755_011414 [Muntiacus reevesi]
MFPLAKNALSRLRVQSTQQAVARQIHQKRAPASGATFCVALWVYMATQIGIEWNPSPVGRVAPEEWREQ